jgi:hypothetical protein
MFERVQPVGLELFPVQLCLKYPSYQFFEHQPLSSSLTQTPGEGTATIIFHSPIGLREEMFIVMI